MKISLIAIVLLICHVLFGYYVPRSKMSKNLLDYFPDVEGDGSKITWAHGINSRDLLKEALHGKTMVLEADVSPSTDSLPVMAHPPTTTSDLTLAEWMASAIKSGKGIKLDFKHLEVVEPSLRILKQYDSQLELPLFLNADILQGPTNPISVPLDAREFLRLCCSLFPNSVLSVGWTTFLDPNVPEPAYTSAMVDEMIEALENSGVSSSRQAVTFPVRACIAKNSVEHLKELLSAVPGSTLTVWSSPGDPVTTQEMMDFRRSFDTHSVYYDLPSPLREEFLHSIAKSDLR